MSTKTGQHHLHQNKSKSHLYGVLDRVASTRDLLTFLHRYTVFNGNFAGGVANLVGAFHIRDDLFQARDVPFAPCADAAARIASCVFFAAEDEYACRKDKSRITHRELAQFLLLESFRYFSVTADVFAKFYQLNVTTREVLKHVKEGYKTDRQNREMDLYHGLGFHLGAEILADEEFNALDKYLTTKHPRLVAHLKSAISPTGFSAYHWIKVHTYVEEEHFDVSARAIDIIHRTYAGTLAISDISAAILRGFDDFAAMQRAFFANILEGEPTSPSFTTDDIRKANRQAVNA